MDEPVADEIGWADHAAPQGGGQSPAWWSGAYPHKNEQDTMGMTAVLTQDVTFLVKGLVESLPIAMMEVPVYNALGRKGRLQA